MFLSSTIYHSMAYGSTHKYVLRIIDHSMIYVAIAGSYTPVVLTLMNNWFGYLIIAIQWGTTIFGILYKIFAKRSMRNLALLLLDYGLVGSGYHSCHYQSNNTNFLESHGNWRTLLYSWSWILRQEKPYFHMIWHLFILAASALQYIS